MANKQQLQILIVEDDLELSEMLNSYFKVQGYQIETIAWGKKAVDYCKKKQPNLVVLDIRLPDIDGYEVCRQLRTFHMTKNIPIIFLTERNERKDKLAGLEMGVVDYITKPFDIQELRLRVRNTLRRANNSESHQHAVTGFPEGKLVDEHLKKMLSGEDAWGISIVTLRGLNHFREKYGFIASDDVLRAASLIMKSAIKELGSEEDLIVHLAANDLLLFTSKKSLQPLYKRISEKLASSMLHFYPLKDRLADDKTDEKQRLSLWMGKLQVSEGPFENVEALKKAALETRKQVRLPV